MSEHADAPYPATTAFRTGWLAVGDGHELYFEESGRRDGPAVVFLHGGPGSGCIAAQRTYFDPAFYRVLLFDQRGCGRSRPAGALHANTTAHLVEDLERLRKHLGVTRWIVFGGSWGATLALAYARRYPQHTQALILRGVFLARRFEVDAYACDIRALLPEAWHALGALFGIDSADAAREQDLALRCAEAVLHDAPQRAREVARAWLHLESAAMALTTGTTSTATHDDPLSPRTRVYMHYLANRYFLRDGELLEGLDVLRELPVTIVQGALDPVCPPLSAWQLARQLPHARLRMIPLAGHGGFEPALCGALVETMNDLRDHLA